MCLSGATSPLDSHHRPILPMNQKSPVIDPTVYVAANASVVGDVEISTGSAVWYGSIIRGDSNSVRIGTESHIQDRAVVSGVKSVASGLPGSVSIGNNVVVGYGSVLSGCRIDDNCRIGSGCRVLEGAHMEANSCLASGSVVEQGKHIPSGEVGTSERVDRSTGRATPRSSCGRWGSTRRRTTCSIRGTAPS